MKSLRTHTFKAWLRTSRSLRNVSELNVIKKRKDLDRLEKYFPVSKSVKIQPVETEDFRAEWISTPESRPKRIVLYIHGGGFVFYPKLYRDFISRVAKQSKAMMLSLDYSLSPEHKFPKAVEETLAAYKWLLKDNNPSDIAIAGDSAGGALTLSLLHRIKIEKLPYPACAVVLSPATDATLASPSVHYNKKQDTFINPDSISYFIDAYFGDTPRDHPVASPLHGSFAGYPPLLVHVDDREIMYDDSIRLVEKARKAGVKVELYESKGLWHVYHLYARYIPEARTAISNIAEFINRHLGE